MLTHRNNQKVAIAYPSPEDLSFRFHRSVFNLLILDAYGGQLPDGSKIGGRSRIGGGGAHLPVVSGAQITKSRNKIVREFLGVNEKRPEQHKIDWLFCIDADMTFDADLIERLIAAAHPEKRPIVGGLCFAFLQDNERKFWPTLYGYIPDSGNALRRLVQYPPDTLLPVAATGAACLLIHRSVLEAMREKYPEPWPWFAETPFYRKDENGERIPGSEDAYSEDITFCLRAQACGFPIFVHTGIKLGHVKSFEADEEAFLAESMALRQTIVPTLPTFVVIPVKKGERDEMTARLVDVLGEQVPPDAIRLDDSDMTITEKWNAGLEWAEKQAAGKPFNVAVLNNDLEVPLEFLARLESGLRQDDANWVSYPDVHPRSQLPNGVAVQVNNPQMAGQTMSGYAFMIRGEAGLRFDEQFRWWYSDSDLEKQVRSAGKKVVTVGGCEIRHLHPMESSRSPEMVAVIREDEVRFAAKWGLEPRSLWLAKHPEFGAEVPV